MLFECAVMNLHGLISSVFRVTAMSEELAAVEAAMLDRGGNLGRDVRVNVRLIDEDDNVGEVGETYTVLYRKGHHLLASSIGLADATQ